MKKVICFLLIFIILLSPLHITRAADPITLTQGSIELLNNGIEFLSYSSGVPYGFLPVVFSSEKDDYQNVFEDMFDKQDVFNIDNTPNIIIRELNESEYSLLENAYVYDDDGNIVSLQELYFGEVDNGYFTEKFYCKNDGSIVYQDNAKQNPYIDVKFGGSEVNYDDWENYYNDLSLVLSDSGYHYSVDGTSVGDVTYYLAVALPNSFAASCFIANQYQPGVIVPAVNGGNIASWYTNDLSLINYESLYGDVPYSYALTVSPGNYNFNGYSYNYLCSFWGNNQSLTWDPDNTFENWVNGINPYNCLFSKIGYTYNASLMNENIVSFKKVVTDEDSIDFSKAYSYSALNDYVGALEGVNNVPNDAFDRTIAISDVNYPIYIDITEGVIEDALPFPGSVAIDDSPAVEFPLDEVIDPSLLTPDIPIISDLQNKFPFSIPWDIARILKGLESERETPYINTDLVIPGINYTWHIEYDLHAFDNVAALFRTLFLISFIIGLAYFSYDHFFGS